MCVSAAPASGMDREDEAMAGRPVAEQHAADDAASTGRLWRVPRSAQASEAGREGKTGDDVQHSADAASTERSAGVPSSGRTAGFGKGVCVLASFCVATNSAVTETIPEPETAVFRQNSGEPKPPVSLVFALHMIKTWIYKNRTRTVVSIKILTETDRTSENGNRHCTSH